MHVIWMNICELIWEIIKTKIIIIMINVMCTYMYNNIICKSKIIIIVIIMYYMIIWKNSWFYDHNNINVRLHKMLDLPERLNHWNTFRGLYMRVQCIIFPVQHTHSKTRARSAVPSSMDVYYTYIIQTSVNVVTSCNTSEYSHCNLTILIHSVIILLNKILMWFC